MLLVVGTSVPFLDDYEEIQLMEDSWIRLSIHLCRNMGHVLRDTHIKRVEN